MEILKSPGRKYSSMPLFAIKLIFTHPLWVRSTKDISARNSEAASVRRWKRALKGKVYDAVRLEPS